MRSTTLPEARRESPCTACSAKRRRARRRHTRNALIVRQASWSPSNRDQAVHGNRLFELRHHARGHRDDQPDGRTTTHADQCEALLQSMGAREGMSTVTAARLRQWRGRTPAWQGGSARSAPLDQRRGPRSPAQDSGDQPPCVGRMFWFARNRLSGSYFALTRASRSYSSGPYAARTRSSSASWVRKLT